MRRGHFSIWLVSAFLICNCAFAQQLLQVENAASLLTGDIAVGSLARLQLIYQGGPITPIDPATVSAQLLPMGFQDPLTLSILKVSGATSVLALIPSDTPLGPASITLSYNGQNSAAQTVNIVATRFGLYSTSYAGPALAQNITGSGIQLNNLTHPAHPQDYITLWGTGLGSETADRVAVLLGGHPFPVAYAGPSADFPGLDQINFQVPDDPAIPQGCYVAVNIEIENSTSNLATLSLSRGPGPCRHPFGLTADQLAQLDAGGQVYVGQIDLYSTIGPPLGSLFSPDYERMESAAARFEAYNASTFSAISAPLFADDSLAGCASSGVVSARLLAPSDSLNVGDQVYIQGPSGQRLTLLPQGSNAISGYTGAEPAGAAVARPDQLPTPFFSAGEWEASVPGSGSVQPFTAMLSIPEPIQVTNYGQVTMADHTQDLIIAWDPTTYSSADFVTVQLFGQGPSEGYIGSSAVFCRVSATAGQATIPAAMLTSFPPAEAASLFVSVGRNFGTAGLFTIGLRDGSSISGAFQYYSAEAILVQFQ
jgi:uncharacterized protein (TIGR03437 family)